MMSTEFSTPPRRDEPIHKLRELAGLCATGVNGKIRKGIINCPECLVGGCSPEEGLEKCVKMPVVDL